jgi:hypothetical protein
MVSNERMHSIPQTAGIAGDELMHTHRQATTRVAAPRNIALVTGVFFLTTIIASIPALVLYGPVLNDPDYIVGAGADTRVFWGALLEVITAIANVGTAVTLFPILKPHNEGVALGYVAARVVESTLIVVGIISLLAVVTVRQEVAGAAGADAAALVLVGKSLVAIHAWTFLLGPGLMPGVNGVLLGYLMYRSALVPRAMALLGLVGGPLLFASAIATLFGLYVQVSVWGGIATLPIVAWELSLAVWLIVKEFNPSATASEPARAGTNERLRAT